MFSIKCGNFAKYFFQLNGSHNILRTITVESHTECYNSVVLRVSCVKTTHKLSKAQVQIASSFIHLHAIIPKGFRSYHFELFGA